jgi:hypothetical protein
VKAALTRALLHRSAKPLLFVLCVVVAVGLNSAMYGGGK